MPSFHQTLKRVHSEGLLIVPEPLRLHILEILCQGTLTLRRQRGPPNHWRPQSHRLGDLYPLNMDMAKRPHESKIAKEVSADPSSVQTSKTIELMGSTSCRNLGGDDSVLFSVLFDFGWKAGPILETMLQEKADKWKGFQRT